jgi:hypothetical protein
MDKKIILEQKKDRLNRLMQNGDKNIKAPGVVRKLKREIRNLSMD